MQLTSYLLGYAVGGKVRWRAVMHCSLLLTAGRVDG